MGISSPGIGSNLDVNAIVSKLLAVEAQPIAILDRKTASFQAKLTGLGTLSGALSGFQSSLSSLTSVSTFQSVSANSGDTSVLVASATPKAVSGIYNVNVTSLAQSQTLATAGQASSTAAIGAGLSTTLSFQLGSVTNGSFGVTGGTLAAGTLTSGVSNGALSINGTAIATDASTRSAKLLAAAINAKNSSTGVTATAGTTSTSATLFGAGGLSTFGTVDASAGTYALSVGGVAITPSDPVDAQAIDALLAGANSATAGLAAANITFTGTAVAGDLQFFSADGNNITVAETITGTVTGGIGNSGTQNGGSSTTASAALTLSSATASPITVGGTNPAALGLTAGTLGSYIGSSFAQDATKTSGTLVIDSTNNSLQGIRDAINKAAFGVTATIVSDGGTNPFRLVLSSTATGANASIKLSLTGASGTAADADPALAALLAYDPGGTTQNLQQKTAAQSTALSVNGIPVTSSNNSVAGAIEGVTLTIGKVGNTNLVVSKNTSSVTSSVNTFVKAYNDLNKSIADLTSFNPETKKAGPLLGDRTVQTLQAQVRKNLTTGITGLTGNLTNLSQLGVSFQKDGSLTLDSAKLQSAITNNFSDIAALFAVVGNASDNLVSFTTSTSATKPGSFALNLSTVATQGTLTSENALGTVTIGADTSFNVTLDDTTPSTANRTASVSLAARDYTPTELATALQSAINGVKAFSDGGLSVLVKVGDDGKLAVSSARFGSASNVAISSKSGTASSVIFGNAASVVGLDVAGTLGGAAATGSGQVLTGSADSDAAGLKVTITGGATGDRGTVGFSQGYAFQLSNLASNFLGAKGFITSQTDGLGVSIKSVAKAKDNFNAKLVDIEKRLRAQYTALDTSISSLNATSAFLTQQFAALSKQTA